MITPIFIPMNGAGAVVFPVVCCILALVLSYLAMLIKNVDLAEITTNIAAVFFGLAIIWFVITAITGLFSYI